MGKAKKALVFEQAPYHYTSLESYLYYLDCLGYEVTLLTYRDFDPREEITGFDFTNINHIVFNNTDWADVNDFVDFEDYDLVWMPTINKLSSAGKNIFEELGFYPQPSEGLYATIHDTEDLNKTGIDPSRFASLFTLTDRKDQLDFTNIVSLSYYGEPEKTKQLSSPRTITSVGINFAFPDVIKYMAHYADQMDSVFQAITHLPSYKFWIYPILKNAINRLRATRRYDSCKCFSFTECIKAKSHVKLSNLPSSKMYKAIHDSDFLLVHYDKDTENTFVNQRVSGTAALSLGFGVPLIATRAIAESWGFDDSNCLIFDDGQLDEGIGRALSMSQEEYDEIRRNLLDKANIDQQATLEVIHDLTGKLSVSD